MRSIMTAFVLVSTAGCALLSSGDTCYTPTSSALVGGEGSLTVGGVASQARTFTWEDGGPETTYASFTFVFGNGRIECSTTSTLASFRGRTALAELVSDAANASACQIVVGDEWLDWTGGTFTVTRGDDGSYTLRLDAAPTVVGDVTVELAGLTGRATFDANACPSSNGWWL